MEKIALKNYEIGYNCAQALLKTFAKELDISEELLMKISSGLGAGMFLGETCGAVTASIIAIGIKEGGKSLEEKSKNREVFKKSKVFEQEFKNKYCSFNCKELKTVCKASCKEIVEDSAKILKSLIV